MADAVAANPGGTETGRQAAGQDGRKRRQILDGARRVFLARGFDAASMSDIAEESHVSKGTLYVYFDSKELLFRELVAEEKAAQFPAIFDFDPSREDVGAELSRVGRALVRFLVQPHVVTAKRTVVAMAERMPVLASEFFEQGPRQCTRRVAEYLDGQVAAGRLAIDDTYLAAAQFIDMSQSTLTTALMFGVEQSVDDGRIATTVEAAVRVFLAAYSAGIASGGRSRTRGSN
jgi:AcrR family transcriptional regulator